MDLIRKMKKNEIIIKGDFTLKNGTTTNTYIDLRKLTSFPSLIYEIAMELTKFYLPNTNDFDIICGTPYGAVPIATIISQILDKPLIMLRKEAKTYGTKKLIEGNYNKNDRVLLIEDVITSGSSVKEAENKLQNEDLIIADIWHIVNRQINPTYKNYLFHINDLQYTTIKEQLKNIINKKGKLCVAADLTNSNDLFNLINKIGNYISVLKLHCDIIEDWNDNTIKTLIKLKRTYNFLIWEDRKFADIGIIVHKQLNKGIYKISSWADLISMHLISGPDILNQVDNIGIIGICSMSSKGALTDDTYLAKSKFYLEQNNNSIGIVTQKDCDTNLLKIVPGISINKYQDCKGQQYSNPSDKKWADLLVVGRYITNSTNIENACLEILNFF